MVKDSLNILHITDLHIHDINDKGEHLCDNTYDEYLNNLSKEIKRKYVNGVDYIIATGDLIDRGINNFKHCQKVLSFVSESLNVDKSNVYICIGNHDIDRKFDEKDDFINARKDIYNLASNYGNGSRIWKSDTKRAIIIKLERDVFLLILDSTLGSKGQDKPGDLSRDEEDELLNAVKEIVPTENKLIVASHHLIERYPGSLSGYSEPNWEERHFWKDAARLRERLYRLRDKSPTVCLSGDIHYADQFQLNNFYFVSTNRLGTRFLKESEHDHRQVKVIEMCQHPKVTTYNYQPRESKITPGFLGDWIEIGSDLRSIKEEDEEVTIHPPITKSHYKSGVYQVVDSKFEEVLYNQVIENKLYKFGRYDTADDKVSLGWIPIGPLLNLSFNIDTLINHFVKWLNENVLISNVDERINNSVFLGLDCWGTIIASQLSVRTGINTFGIASRAKGRYHTALERIDSKLENILASKNLIILVTDVVATGQSLNFIYEEITKKIKKEPNRRFIALSILLDKGNNLNLNFLSKSVTACSKVKIPIISKDDIPNSDIIPPDISFR